MLGFNTELPYTRIRVPPCKLLGNPSDAILVTQSHQHFNNHSTEFTDRLPCGRLCLGLSLSYIHSTLIDEEIEAQRGAEMEPKNEENLSQASRPSVPTGASSVRGSHRFDPCVCMPLKGVITRGHKTG